MKHIERFLLTLRAENKSVHTLDNYQRDLISFVMFYFQQMNNQAWSMQDLMADPQVLDWRGVDVGMVKSYVMSQVQSGLGARSLARHLSALRSFFQFLISEGIVSANPAKLVKAPKQPQPLPKSLDIDQTNQLLEQPIETWQAIRNQAIFELLYSAGLRVSELVGLDLSPGLDGLDSGQIQVLGKGKKMRLALAGAKAQQAMQAWLKVRLQKAKPEETAVFVNQRGSRLSVRSIQQQLDQRAIAAGIVSKMSPHRLRHACATHVLESSGDLRAVQELLGHANLSTTQIYTKLDMQHLAQVYDQTHPRARKNK